MIDIKKFILEILKNRLNDEIQFQTGKKNNDIEKSIFIENIASDYNNMYYSQTFFKQDLRMTINWSENYTETREQALNIYNIIKSIEKVLYDENTLIVRCKMLTDFPTDNNTSNNKIYSQNIDFQIQYAVRR